MDKTGAMLKQAPHLPWLWAAWGDWMGAWKVHCSQPTDWKSTGTLSRFREAEAGQTARGLRVLILLHRFCSEICWKMLTDLHGLALPPRMWNRTG